VFVFYSVFRDGLSDLSGSALNTSEVELEGDVCDLPANMSDSQQPANLGSQQQEQQQQQQQQQLNLMTPDAFSSPAKKDSPDLRSPQVSSAVVQV
jgi:hypothetical protein